MPEELQTKEMQTYQLNYLLSSRLAPEEVLKQRNEFAEILASSGAQITQSADPAKKKLAYTLGGEWYVFAGEFEFWTPSSTVPELMKHIRLELKPLRFIVTKKDERAGMLLRSRRRRTKPIPDAQKAEEGSVTEMAFEPRIDKNITRKDEQESKAAPKKSKISLEEIDKKLDEIMGAL